MRVVLCACCLCVCVCCVWGVVLFASHLLAPKVDLPFSESTPITYEHLHVRVRVGDDGVCMSAISVRDMRVLLLVTAYTYLDCLSVKESWKTRCWSLCEAMTREQVRSVFVVWGVRCAHV